MYFDGVSSFDEVSTVLEVTFCECINYYFVQNSSWEPG